jgi:hypothetical protein
MLKKLDCSKQPILLVSRTAIRVDGDSRGGISI